MTERITDERIEEIVEERVLQGEDISSGELRMYLDELLTALKAERAECERLRAERQSSFDRESLGQLVRIAWVEWAREQKSPKPSWLTPWEELSESDKEADRRIGEFIVSKSVNPELLRLESKNERLEEWMTSLGTQNSELLRLLMRAYAAGHREGWQPGEATDDVMDDINNVLSDAFGNEWLSDYTTEQEQP